MTTNSSAHASSMAPTRQYNHEPSSAYGTGPYVDRSGQVATHTTPPPPTRSRHQPSYDTGSQQMRAGGRPSSGSSSRQVPRFQPQPLPISNAPATPMHPDYSFLAGSQPTPYLPGPSSTFTMESQPLPALTIPESPNLGVPHDSSPWEVSSASESPYSTPSEAYNQRPRAMSPSLWPEWPGTFESYSSGSPIQGLDFTQDPSLFSSYSYQPISSFSSYPTLIPDVPISYQEEHTAILGGAHASDPYSSVRSSLTPQTAMSGAHPTEHLVTLPGAVSGTFTVLGTDGSKDAELGAPPFCLGNPHLTAMALPSSILSSIPRYLSKYWECFDVQFPLLHRATFESSGGELLRCAMGAIATQFMPDKEDHVRGKQLHEFAVQELRRVSKTDPARTEDWPPVKCGDLETGLTLSM